MATTANQPTVLDWLTFALKIKEARSSGHFVMPPLTPQQQAMFDRVNRMLDTTPPTTAFWPILGYDLSHPSTIDIAALKRGEVGFTPAQHMSPEDLAKVLANAKPTGGAPNTTTSPGATGAPTNGAPGDPFGHMTAPAGSQGDPFGGWPGPSNTAHNVTWEDIKVLGPQAISAANAIISATPGIALSAVYNLVRKILGNANDSKGGDQYGLTGDNPKVPSRQQTDWLNDPQTKQLSIDGHPIYQATPQQLAGQTFLSSQMRGMQGNGTGTPEGQGIGQPGFGYGLDYGSFHNGNDDGGDPSWNAPNQGSPFRRGLVGQRA